MTLVKCKECGKMVSDTTEKCIHCGNLISSNEKEKTIEKSKNNGNKKMVAFLLSLVASICGFIELVKTSASGLVLIYTLFSVASCILLTIYNYPNGKKKSDFLFLSLTALLICSLVRIFQIGIGLEYLIRYSLLAISSILLIYSTYRDNKKINTMTIILLAIIGIDAIYNFFDLNNSIIKGYYWRLYLIVETLLPVAMIFTEYSKDNLNKKIKDIIEKLPKKIILIGSVIVLAIVFYLLSLDENTSFNDNSNNSNSNVIIRDNDNSNDNGSDNNTNTKQKTINLEIGQSIDYADNYSIEMISANYSQNVKPTKPDSYYSYYEIKDKSLNTYVVLKTKIKNLGADTLEGDNLPKATLIYDNKYKYDAFSITELDDGSDLEGYDWYQDIDPLKTKKIWYLVEVPLEVKDNTEKSVKIQFEIDDKIYLVNVR